MFTKYLSKIAALQLASIFRSSIFGDGNIFCYSKMGTGIGSNEIDTGSMSGLISVYIDAAAFKISVVITDDRTL